MACELLYMRAGNAISIQLPGLLSVEDIRSETSDVSQKCQRLVIKPLCFDDAEIPASLVPLATAFPSLKEISVVEDLVAQTNLNTCSTEAGHVPTMPAHGRLRLCCHSSSQQTPMSKQTSSSVRLSS